MAHHDIPDQLISLLLTHADACHQYFLKLCHATRPLVQGRSQSLNDLESRLCDHLDSGILSSATQAMNIIDELKSWPSDLNLIQQNEVYEIHERLMSFSSQWKERMTLIHELWIEQKAMQ